MNRSASNRSASNRSASNDRRGQSLVEYMLGISVIVVALAAGFIAFGDGVSAVFSNVRTTVQTPYP